jgi:hypothetical protein
MNILMEKKKSERIKGRLRVEKALLTIHLKIEFWRRAQRASEGFSWKPISVLGFGSETICPSREIGEAIPVSHLQVLAL